MSKILILGAKGMLGSALMRAFSDVHPVGWGVTDVDITDEKRIQEKIHRLKPQAVINAAAYTDVDMAESAEDLATKINGHAVGYIAEAAAAIDAVLVHYSTDYVFDGTKKDGYNERDDPSPINAYGRSKLAGENELQKKGKDFYLLRTSWLFGKGRENFVSRIVEKAKRDAVVRVVFDQFGKPTYTKDLAEQTRMMIQEKLPFGIYHVTNETPKEGITWYDFAKEILSQKKLSVPLVPCRLEDLRMKASRPRYSVLVNTKLPAQRLWDEALREYLA